jgi:hypothetical protein
MEEQKIWWPKVKGNKKPTNNAQQNTTQKTKDLETRISRKGHGKML